jgi:hypothetical protein
MREKVEWQDGLPGEVIGEELETSQAIGKSGADMSALPET